MSELVALEGRVTRLESAYSRLEGVFATGLSEIKELIRGEITDIKNEQIADLRDANRRLADDQRRLWEALRVVENRENQRTGSDRTTGKAFTALMMLITAGVASFMTWLAGLFSVHPHP
jgi:hypothetical protein